MSAYTVLAVDDEEINLDILEKTLTKNDFDVVCSSNSNKCLKILEDQVPDIILLDVKMPDTNGFELCEIIKKTQQLKEIPIIFISAMDSTEDIIKGYASGCADYITKPFKADELLAKIENNIRYKLETDKLKKKAQNAKETAFLAMSDSNELGTVIQFMDGSNNIGTFDNLAKKTFECLQELQLQCSLIFHTHEGPLFYSDDGIEKPLEKELILKLRANLEARLNKNGRFFTFKNRLVVSQTNVSLLVKNAPSDPTKVGRLRDILGALINCMEARSASLSAERAMQKRKELTTQVMSATKDTLSNLEQLFKIHEHETSEIMDNLLLDMQTGFSYLGLTDEQEKHFVNMLEQAMQRLISLYTNGVKIDEGFTTLMKALRKLSEENQT